jgi:hypothetical protein
MKINLNHEKAAVENKTFPTATLRMKKFTTHNVKQFYKLPWKYTS